MFGQSEALKRGKIGKNLPGIGGAASSSARFCSPPKKYAKNGILFEPHIETDVKAAASVLCNHELHLD